MEERGGVPAVEQGSVSATAGRAGGGMTTGMVALFAVAMAERAGLVNHWRSGLSNQRP